MAQTPSTKTFKARLSTVPLATASSHITRIGSVTATLTGRKLVLTGIFEELGSPATVARLHRSPKPGIRGPILFELDVTKATSGSIAGAFDLTPAQAQEVAQNRYYVQLHTESAPEGSLWGWLFLQENAR